MRAERLIEYFNLHFAEAIQQLERYSKTNKVEALHQFRVNIKKIRAVFKLLKSLRPGKKLKQVNHHVRVIFWKAGELRDQQLKLAWLRRSRKKELIAFFNIEEELRQTNEQWKEEIPGYLKELNSLRQEGETLPADILGNEASAYFINMMLKVKVSIAERPKPVEWHQLRKNIKQVLYAVHWLEEETTIRMQQSPLMVQLNQLQEKIGAWHDEILLKVWLGEKQAFLSEDPIVLKQFDAVWKRLIYHVVENETTIKNLLRRINRLKFSTLAEK